MKQSLIFAFGLGIAFSASGISANASVQNSATQMRLENPGYTVESVIASDIRIDFAPLQLEQIQENAQLWTRVEMENAGIVDQPGSPSLPTISTLVQIPDHSDVRFELVDSAYEILPLRAPVYPQQERMHDTTLELPLSFLQDTEAYAQSVFPELSYTHGEPALLRNTRVVKLTTFPVQVVQGGTALKVYTQMTLRPVFEGRNELNARTFEIGNAASSMSRITEELVVNHHTSVEHNERGIFDSSFMPGNYLVIARNSTITNESYFRQWVDWKREKGHQLVVAGETEIGGWTNTSIRNYVINAYQSWTDTPDFLVLIGDTGSSGAYQLPGGAGSTYSGEQDHYYSRLEGNDILGDIAVGRISVSNSSQLSNVFNKILLYERNPGNDASWLGRAAVATGYSANSMVQQSRTIAADLVEHGYTQIDSSWYPSTNSTWVEQRYNSGIGMYNYRGWIGMNGVSASWVDSHFNNVGRPVVSVIFTCATGDFNNGYATTEAFLRNGSVPAPKGGVCALGFSTANTHTAYNNAVVGGFWNGVSEYEYPEVGVSLFLGKYTLYLTMPPGDSNPENFANWANLMGDPGMYLWLGEPEALSASHESSLITGQSHTSVTVSSGGNPVENAVVCLYQTTTGMQSRVLSNAAGEALINLEGFSAGSVKLTAMKANKLVYQANLNISSAASHAEISDAGISGSGAAIPGQVLTLLPLLENTGTSVTLTGLSAVASLDPAYGSISDATAAWPNVGAGGSASANNSLSLTLDPGLAVGTVAPLHLSVSSGQGTYDDVVELLVSAPAVFVTNISFSPGGAVIQPGVTATMTLTLSNAGSLDASGLACVLSSSDPVFSVIDGTDTSGNFPEAGSTTVSFTVDADNGAFGGYQAQTLMQWTADGQITGELALTIPIGSTSAESPTGPDSYGYRAYEDTDSNTKSPIYSWVPLAPAEGGSGTLVPLTDTFDEGDDSHLMSLPFNFQYYGLDYSQIAVCSNGFVALGPNANIETDYRNHPFPSGLGPDAMIAPMWDDFIVGGGANVYTKYFSADHTFVIEWYNMGFNGDSGSNTFQLILFDPAFYPTPTGDGEMVFQYLNFENVQDHSYDFPYCSIGIKNHTSTDGLTLSNYNLEPSSISGINDNKAIRITTALGSYSNEDLVPPVISHLPPAVSFAGTPIVISANVVDNHSVASVALFYDSGLGFVQQNMSNTSGSTWTASIPAQSGGGTVSYYIRATDAADTPNVSTTITYELTIYDVLFVEDFDGAHGFTHAAFGGYTDEWHSESARTHSVPNAFKFGGAGTADYGPNGAGWLNTPEITVDTEATDLQFSFWSWIEGETSGFYPDSCYDGGVVEMSLNGGAWQEAIINPAYTHSLRERSVVPLDFPRVMLSGTQDWSQYSVQIPDGTQSVAFRFGFVSDNGTQLEGWYIDDVLLTGLVPQPADPVTDLRIAVGGPSVALLWTAVAEAQAYNVYVSDVPDSFPPTPDHVVAVNFWAGATNSAARQFYRVTVVR